MKLTKRYNLGDLNSLVISVPSPPGFPRVLISETRVERFWDHAGNSGGNVLGNWESDLHSRRPALSASFADGCRGWI
jgi:hypothetical protein